MDLADTVDHRRDLFDVRLLRLDPQQVGAVIERRDAIHDTAVGPGSFAELEEVRRQTLRTHQLAIAIEDHVAVARGCRVDLFAV